LNITFAILIILCFAFFSFYSRVTNIIFAKDKIDVFKEDLDQIAFYFWSFDKDLSKFLVTLDDIVQWYNKSENILETKVKEIDYCWDYVKKNKNYLSKLWFSQYDGLMSLMTDLWAHKKEFFDLLGKDKPYNYLVILQNTNEKRPNGWFFWSFAFVKIYQWHIQDLEIVDSYYPDFIAYRTRIIAPTWTSVFLPDRKIWFIAGNKFGFTDIDGKNLKDLYELMFNKTYEMRKVQKTMEPALYNKLLNQDIKWVIFIRSDLLEYIFPDFKKKAREWQFVNASVDLIRKEIRGNKKELYIKEIKDYFAKQKTNIIKNVINNFSTVVDDQFLNIYLSNVSQEFYGLLAKNHLFNTFRNDSIYAWDTNVSFNKVDSFVKKEIKIYDDVGNIKIDTDKDIINILKLDKWVYNMEISYTLDVPEEYTSFITSLEKKYGIQLTEREFAILAVKSEIFDDSKYGKVRKWRETKSTIYFPTNIKVLKVDGEIYYQAPFYPWFANWLFYQMGTEINHTTKTIKIKIEIK